MVVGALYVVGVRATTGCELDFDGGSACGVLCEPVQKKRDKLSWVRWRYAEYTPFWMTERVLRGSRERPTPAWKPAKPTNPRPELRRERRQTSTCVPPPLPPSGGLWKISLVVLCCETAALGAGRRAIGDVVWDIPERECPSSVIIERCDKY